jgi:hypothetical protein
VALDDYKTTASENSRCPKYDRYCAETSSCFQISELFVFCSVVSFAWENRLVMGVSGCSVRLVEYCSNYLPPRSLNYLTGERGEPQPTLVACPHHCATIYPTSGNELRLHLPRLLQPFQSQIVDETPESSLEHILRPTPQCQTKHPNAT